MCSRYLPGLLLALLAICRAENRDGLTPHRPDDVANFNWTALQASPRLEYAPCYDGYECARLEVPLDWTNSSNHHKAQIAIIRLRASVPESDPSFGGTILLNPGGPGGSGVDLLRWTGGGIRDIVDSDKHFELLSWDPRAVHFTTPKSSCFADDYQRSLWSFKNAIVGPMDASNASFSYKWALSQDFGKVCAQSDSIVLSDRSNVLKFATTALTVKDMIRIIDEVQVLHLKSLGSQSNVQKQQSLRSSPPALLNYWGYSYGSYLGNAFASMFPSRVGRMIMDSVVDTDDYTATGWLSNLIDYNNSLSSFYQYCLEAESLCPLNTPGESSVEALAAKTESLLHRLKNDPIPVSHDGTADVVTFSDVSSLLLTTMYHPQYSWPELAQIIADLILSNTTSMIPYLPKLALPAIDSNTDEVGRQLLAGKNITLPYPPNYSHLPEASHAIACGDGNDVSKLSKDDWYQRMTLFSSQSPIVGWKWSEIPLLCTAWPKDLRPADRNRFTGPFSSQLSEYDPRASPLLFIGGTADPVLPLRNAFKAASRHEGARVLIQNAPGHCSGYVNPNICTFAHIKKFFGDGELPQNGTVCEADRSPWFNS